MYILYSKISIIKELPDSLITITIVKIMNIKYFLLILYLKITIVIEV